MQAILTKYLGPTNYRGARIKAMASSRGPYVVLPWDYGLGQTGNHDAAAAELASQLGWLGSYHGADMDADSRVYVRTTTLYSIHPLPGAFPVTATRPQCRTVATRRG